MNQSTRDGLERRSWLAVVSAYQECNRRYAQMLSSAELTVPQFDVLNTIEWLGVQATPRAIAEQLLVTKGNITGLLRRLQQASLIDTEANPDDARSFRCRLTAAGRAQLERARQLSKRFVRAQLAPFTSAELQTIEQLMEQMRGHLQSIDPNQLCNEYFSERGAIA